MGLFREFKAFLMKGDIVNLATAVIIGGAFGKIVASFTEGVLMPPIGLLLGGVNFNELQWVLQEEVQDAAGAVTQAAVSIHYGSFLQTVIDFIIIGFFVFMVLRNYEKNRKQAEVQAEAPKGPTQEELLTEIRDELRRQRG